MNLLSIFAQLHLQVLQRGWLSSNNIVFHAVPGSSAAVVDTGYGAHAEQTVGLLRTCLAGEPLARVFNTHLHSDHCGGNAAMQRIWNSETAVPEVSLDAVLQWDRHRLTFDNMAQGCERFAAHRGLEAGSLLMLGGHHWKILRAPGHDADALMFFEPKSRVLISGDALWESRLAIVFPEFEQKQGFAGVEEVLGAIAELNPSVVIPGHGPPFNEVPRAICASMRRLRRFQQDPAAHRQHALRALTMFHMLEIQRAPMDQLLTWLLTTPIFGKLMVDRSAKDGPLNDMAESMILRMIADGILVRNDNMICIATARTP